MKIATHYTDIIISKIIITNCRNLKIRTHRKCVATQPLAALRQAMACCSGVIQIRIFFSSLGPLDSDGDDVWVGWYVVVSSKKPGLDWPFFCSPRAV